MKVQLLHSSIGAAKFINALSEPLPVLWLRETLPIGTANVYIGVIPNEQHFYRTTNIIVENDYLFFGTMSIRGAEHDIELVYDYEFCTRT